MINTILKILETIVTIFTNIKNKYIGFKKKRANVKNKQVSYEIHKEVDNGKIDELNDRLMK